MIRAFTINFVEIELIWHSERSCFNSFDPISSYHQAELECRFEYFITYSLYFRHVHQKIGFFLHVVHKTADLCRLRWFSRVLSMRNRFVWWFCIDIACATFFCQKWFIQKLRRFEKNKISRFFRKCPSTKCKCKCNILRKRYVPKCLASFKSRTVGIWVHD